MSSPPARPGPDPTALLEAAPAPSRPLTPASGTSVDHLRRAIRVDNVGIAFFTADGRITECNDAFLHMSGLAREQVLHGQVTWDSLCPPDTVPQAQRTLEEFRSQGRTAPYERECIRPDGSRWWALMASTQIGDDEGVQYVIDITQRHSADQRRQLAERELAESRELLRLVVESARDYAIISTDLQRRITSWSAGAEHLIGLSEREVLGCCADMLFTAEERDAGIPQREAELALAHGRAGSERWHVRSDGSRFFASGVMMSMRNSEGRALGFVKIFRDETEAREAQQALKQSQADLWQALQDNERARADLEAASRAKDQFLAVLSHELRTPLTPVLMAAQALAMRSDLPDAVQAAVRMIQRNVRLEAQSIDDLLDLTSIARGNLAVERMPMDLHDAVRGAVESCGDEIESKRQHLAVRLEAEKHTCDGDARRLRQAITNVLKNAVKFTPIGGAIEVRSTNRNGSFVLAVVDSGIGIKPEKLPTVFEAFAQGGEWVAREYGGLGLGLAISRATVEAHGGAMHADSAGPDQGAAVVIELPLQSQAQVSR
jgi:two-component system CheB/CheR fusion protein